jgi:inosose dehydratase
MKTILEERREFLKRAAGVALACCASARALDALPNPVGYATITWPERKFPQALETVSALGFKGVQMLGWVRDFYRGLSLTRLKEQLQALKLKPVALSCSQLRLDPADTHDETAELRAYAEFFERLGGLYLQVMDGGGPGKEYTARQIRALASRMDVLGRVAEDHGLSLGYHPHFGTLGETREGLGRVLDATDPHAVKLIADVAHLALGGADPAEVIRTYHDRLLFTHFKDVRKDVAELARQNRDLVRKRENHFCEIGSGVVDFPAILRAFRDVQFSGWVIIELDDAGPGGPSASARANKGAVQRLGLKV